MGILAFSHDNIIAIADADIDHRLAFHFEKKRGWNLPQFVWGGKMSLQYFARRELVHQLRHVRLRGSATIFRYSLLLRYIHNLKYLQFARHQQE